MPQNSPKEDFENYEENKIKNNLYKINTLWKLKEYFIEQKRHKL